MRLEHALGEGEGEGVVASMRKKPGFTHLDGKRSTYTHTADSQRKGQSGW